MSLGVRFGTLSGRLASSVASCGLHHSSSLRATDLSTVETGEGLAGVKVPEKRRTGLDASFRKGTGGRASFSGNVITVFGATGFLGRAVINRLSKEGNQIIIPYRCDPYDVRQLKITGELGQILFLPWEITDENTIRKVMKYSNIVINLTGRHIETWNHNFYDVHEHGARRIAKIAREMGIRRLIHVSAMNANENPEPHLIPGGSQILRSKARGERAVREEFPDATIIRPADMYGLGDRFFMSFGNFWRRNLRCIHDKYTVHYPLYMKGEETYKMPIFVSDVAVGIHRLVMDETTDGQTYEFVGPHCYKLADVVRYMIQRTGLLKEFSYHAILVSGCTMQFWLKTNINELRTFLFKNKTAWDWEHIERVETVSDVLTGCPTLQDLGIRDLHVLEWTSKDVLKNLSAQTYRQWSLEDYVEVEHPPHYSPLRLGHDKPPKIIEMPTPGYTAYSSPSYPPM